jgi:hypothetical protein
MEDLKSTSKPLNGQTGITGSTGSTGLMQDTGFETCIGLSCNINGAAGGVKYKAGRSAIIQMTAQTIGG